MCHAAKYIPGMLSRAPASETHHREMLSKPFWYWTENLPLLSSSRVWMSPSSPIPGNSLFTPAYYNTACLIMSSLSPWGHPDISSLEAHITVRGRRLKKNKFKEHPEDLVVWSALLSLSVFWPPFRSGLVCWAATRPPGSTACSRFPCEADQSPSGVGLPPGLKTCLSGPQWPWTASVSNLLRKGLDFIYCTHFCI